jgi:hypothetical protein
MPWVIVGLAVFAAGGALVGRRKVAIAWLASFAALGAVGLWDFWKWEYSYGHDLDIVHAIIKVPGMTYQPPLIGSKQLLNFTATSWPASGTYLLALAFILGVSALVATRRTGPRDDEQFGPRRTRISSGGRVNRAAILAIALALFSRSARGQRTLEVSPDGAFRTLAAAVAAAHAGDRVVIHNGVYRGPTAVVDKRLTIEGQASAILDGEARAG